MNALYLHGFASSPGSAKACFFAERLQARGAAVVVPDLNEDDFSALTVRRMRATVRQALEALSRPRIVVGSSLGGYVAALCATEVPVDALVLLAPAFDPVARWTAKATAGQLAAWQQEGSALFYHHAWQEERPLRWAFFADAGQHEPWPASTVPTLVLQGLQDDVVPPETARRFVASNPHAILVELAADHEMSAVLPRLWDEVERFLADLGL